MSKKQKATFSRPGKTSKTIHNKILDLSDDYRERFGDTPKTREKNLIVNSKRIGFRVYDGGING